MCGNAPFVLEWFENWEAKNEPLEPLNFVVI